jgi:hypothetical protein
MSEQIDPHDPAYLAAMGAVTREAAHLEAALHDAVAGFFESKSKQAEILVKDLPAKGLVKAFGALYTDLNDIKRECKILERLFEGRNDVVHSHLVVSMEWSTSFQQRSLNRKKGVEKDLRSVAALQTLARELNAAANRVWNIRQTRPWNYDEEAMMKDLEADFYRRQAEERAAEKSTS